MSFAAASTIGEALAAMAGGARPVAGGSDLVVLARQGVAALPDSLVAIDRIADLKVIEAGDDGVNIGAGVNHATLMTEPVVVTNYTALADGAALVGSPATRNVGTLGGNIMNGSPAMDTGAPLVALGASVLLQSTSGSRRIGVTGLWTGNRTNTASDDELCVAIRLPVRPADSGSAYVRLEYRRAMEIAVAGAAASVTLAEDGTVESGTAALTAVAATITELTGAGTAMAGKTLDEAAESVGKLASETATPITDLRASDEYRRHTVGVMAKRATLAAGRRAGGETIPVPVNRAEGVGAAS